jgi:hypothetical protein
MKKKAYQRPEVKEVMLTAEDAVLANCKATSGANKNSSRCRSLGGCPSNKRGS